MMSNLTAYKFGFILGISFLTSSYFMPTQIGSLLMFSGSVMLAVSIIGINVIGK